MCYDSTKIKKERYIKGEEEHSVHLNWKYSSESQVFFFGQ